MKDIFDSADWAREALAKKETAFTPGQMVRFQFSEGQLYRIVTSVIGVPPELLTPEADE